MTNPITAKILNIINSNQENWFQTTDLLEEQLVKILDGESEFEDVFMFFGRQQGQRQLGDCVFNQDGWVVYCQGGQEDAWYAFKREIKDDCLFGCFFTAADVNRASEEA